MIRLSENLLWENLIIYNECKRFFLERKINVRAVFTQVSQLSLNYS